MQFEQNAQVLSSTSKPYIFNGKDGISYKVRVLIGADVYDLKAENPPIYTKATAQLGKDSVVSLKLNQYQGRLSLVLTDIKASK